MVSNPELNEILENSYHEEIRRIIGLGIPDLSLENFDMPINDYNPSHQEWSFIDSGLSEQNLALYFHCLNDTDTADYCAVRNFPCPIPNQDLHDYTLCFNENAVDAVEEAVKKAEFIKAIFYAIEITRNRVNQIQEHRNLESEEVIRILNGRVKNSCKNRRRLWHEIHEGIRRTLGNKPDDCNTLTIPDANFSQINNNQMLTLHGHEFRNFIRTNSYALDSNNNDLQPDIFLLGHYHLQMVMIKFNAVIVFTGTYLSSRLGYRNELLSHMGTPIPSIGLTINVRMIRNIPI